MILVVCRCLIKVPFNLHVPAMIRMPFSSSTINQSLFQSGQQWHFTCADACFLNRAMVESWFSPEKSEAMRPFTQKAADELVDEMLRKQRPVDLMEAFATPLPFKVCDQVQCICSFNGCFKCKIRLYF